MRTWIIAIVAGTALATAASHASDTWAQDSCMAVAEAIERYREAQAESPTGQIYWEAQRAYSAAIDDCGVHGDQNDYDAMGDCERRAKHDLDDAMDVVDEVLEGRKQEYIQALKEAYDGPRSENPSVTDRLMGQWEQQCLRQFGYIK